MPKLVAESEHTSAVLHAKHIILLVKIGDINELPANAGGDVRRQHAVLAFERPETLSK